MKLRSLTGAAFAALFALTTHVSAAPTASPGYAAYSIYAHTSSDSIVSFDWDASANLHYMTTAGFPDVNIWRTTGGAPVNIYAAPSNFAGANVVAIGNYIYFNDSDLTNLQYIRGYEAASVAPTVTALSTTPNYGLFGHNGDLFITGANGGYGPNRIYFSDLAGDGDLLDDPAISLGQTSSGGSGPLTFDLAGNLFYAPGFGDKSIYRFTTAEVAAALADPLANPLTGTGNLWLDYSLLYPDQGGATSMLVEADGDLLVTITDFSNPSFLTRFDAAPDGSYENTYEQILTDSLLIGQLREHDGGLYVSSENAIYQIVPEPGTALLLIAGLGALALRRSRRAGSGLAKAASFTVAAVLAASGSVQAGPFSSYSGITAGAPDNPIAKATFTIFETSVVNYAPSPGVGPSFRAPATSLASLGELYSPVAAPGTNSPFDKIYRPATGAEPSSSHNGATVSPFGGDVNDTGDTYGFIGLDQPGSLTLGFSAAIFDGAGADFAVFENGFAFGGPTSLFAEFAFVEVSSNGTDFARFAAISTNTAPTATSGSFQGFDVTNVSNLAGKHASDWGTPFDLAELVGSPLVTGGLLDLAAINYVRLVDVVGSGELLDGGTPIAGIARDSLGNPILDNWLTFNAAGFDYLGLPTRAVGVVHSAPEPTSALLLGLSAVAFGSRRRR